MSTSEDIAYLKGFEDGSNIVTETLPRLSAQINKAYGIIIALSVALLVMTLLYMRRVIGCWLRHAPST